MHKFFIIKVGLFAIMIGSPLQAARVPTQIVSQAVGQVDEHVVTSREVQISWVLDKALQSSSANRSDWLLKTDSVEFQKYLSQVLLELAVSLEAENFSMGQVTSSEIQTSINRVKAAVAGWQSWKDLEVSEAELEQIATTKLRAQRFLKFKTETSGAHVSEAEVQSYYEKNKAKFGNTPMAQVKGQIKDYLSKELLQQHLKDWFEILKRKYHVKLLGA